MKRYRILITSNDDEFEYQVLSDKLSSKEVATEIIVSLNKEIK